jgi:hypothetical protein
MVVIMIVSGCGMKPISSPYYDVPTVKQVIKPHITTKPLSHTIVPNKLKKELYSIHEYARYMYEPDCAELLFRKDALYERDIKQYALDTIDALDSIGKNIQKYHCK